jgi:two-component system, response regulator PdtaR
MPGDSMLATQIGAKPERPTVLVVEDEVLIRLLIAEELRNQGIHVLEASHAEEALTVLESTLPVHVLFTDIRMPGRLDGIGLSRLARERYPHIKLMLTSSHQPEGYARASADVFIFKPYDLGAVVRDVEALLAPFGYEPKNP